jgi:hypothetical protein
VAEFEQHLTNEHLSAMLDGQLSEDEQEYARKHLPTCEQCQQRQAELRQMVALLHALPQPALPRSFALPLDMTLTEQTLTPIKEARRPLRSRPATPLFPNYVYSTLRAISTIAAVIGIIFLLTSLFPTHMGGSATSSTGMAVPAAGTINRAQNDTTLTQEAMSPHALNGTPEGGGLALSTPTAPITPPPPHITYGPTQPGIIPVAPPVSPVVSLFDLSTVQGRATLGFLLLVLGIIGLTIFRHRKRSIKTTNVP